MKSKLILLATAAMFVATNAQAGFLTPESQRCTSNRPYGIYKPGSTRQGNCDVAANRADAQWVDQAGRPDETPVGAPGSLVGVPRDTISPLVPKELDAAARDTIDRCRPSHPILDCCSICRKAISIRRKGGQHSTGWLGLNLAL